MVLWQGLTEGGTAVPIQVTEEGKVVAQGQSGEKGDKGDPGEPGPAGPPGEYGPGDDVEFGTATFAGGDLAINNSGNLACQRGGSTGYVKLNSTGIAQVRGAGGGSVFQIFNDSDSGASSVQIQGDGSASFAGNIQTGSWNGATGSGTTVGASGTVAIRPATDTSANIFSVIPTDTGQVNVAIRADGSATFASTVVGNSSNSGVVGGDFRGNSTSPGAAAVQARQFASSGITFQGRNSIGTATFEVLDNGAATFSGDVVIGSRNKSWMIVESGGLAHLVEQTFRDRLPNKIQPRGSKDEPSEYPALRDIPSELSMVEQQLQKVMEHLKMVPIAGWEVWDGAD